MEQQGHLLFYFCFIARFNGCPDCSNGRNPQCPSELKPCYLRCLNGNEKRYAKHDLFQYTRAPYASPPVIGPHSNATASPCPLQYFLCRKLSYSCTATLMSFLLLSTSKRLQHDMRLDAATLNCIHRICPRGPTDPLVHKNVRIPERHSTQLQKCFRLSVIALQGHT